jgi:transcriptional regulator with XRE-family HTH domain
MSDVVDRLRRDFRDPDYRHTYAEGFLNSFLATQIKVLREERNWTQTKLAAEAKLNQSRISELEDVNFNSWTTRTLRKLCKAFDLRLKISFEDFGTLLTDFRNLNRESLSRHSFAKDPAFNASAKPPQSENRLALPSASIQGSGGIPLPIGASGMSQAPAARQVQAASSGQVEKRKAEVGPVRPFGGSLMPIPPQTDLSPLEVAGGGR